MGYDGSITISTQVDTKEFDKQIDYIEGRLEEIEYLLEQADLGFEVGDTQKLEAEYEKLSNRLIDLRKRKEDVNNQPIADDKTTGNFIAGVEKVTRKITKMGLAMIGIRSLYGMIASSVSRITESDMQLQAQIEAIQNALDNIVARLVAVLLPIIENVVGLIGSLLKDLFGIDIYSNNFNKNMKKATGAATKLRKQLLGFDEINILNKDGSIGGLGAVTGGDGDGGVPPTQTKRTLKEIGNTIIDAALEGGGIGGGIAEVIFGKDSVITKGIKKINKATMKASLGIAVPIWQWLFGKKKEGTVEDLKDIVNTNTGMIGALADNLKDEFEDISISYKDNMYEITTKTGQTVRLTEADFKGLMQALGKDADFMLNSMTIAATGIQGAFKDSANNTKTNWWNLGDSIIQKFQGTNGVEGVVKGAIAGVEQSSKQSATNIENSFKLLPSNLKNVFNSLSSTLATGAAGVGGAVTGALNKTINNGLSSAETTINNGISIFKTLLNNASAGLGVAASAAVTAKIGLLKAIKFPRLAKGGIIFNQPGRGINYGMANIAERGREGVIPLDNESAMSTLATEIAKRITINLTNVTELDGRQIARNITQVINDTNFASNGVI